MIDLDGLQVGGISLGGFASSLDVPSFKVAIDLGRCLNQVVSRDLVLITHAHLDHLGSIAQHAAQRGLRRLPPATYVLPPGVKDAVEDLLTIWRRLDGGDLAVNLVELLPGESYRVRRDLVVRPFATQHRVTSQGYLFERKSKKLLPEYADLSSDEIRDLRLGGTEVSSAVSSVELCVTGDTILDPVLEKTEVCGAPRLVMECTFFDDRVSVGQARDMGHIHLDEIIEAHDRFSCDALLLNHLSPRHSRRDAERILKDRLPPALLAKTQVMVGDVA